MKLKLKKDELNALINTLRNCEEVSFNTKLEQKICGALIKEFVVKIAKKSIELTPKVSVSIDDQTAHALNFVMPQLVSEDAYSLTVTREIHAKINQACLSL